MVSNRKQKIEKSFGKKVLSYNKHAILQKECAANFCTILPQSSPQNILEIGCGTGFLTEKLQKKYPAAKITAIDIAPEMVNACRQKFTGYKNLSFQTIDGEDLNLNEKFDLIVTNLTVQWFNNPVQGLENLRNILTTNGEIYFSTIGQKNFQEWKKILEELNLPSGILETPEYKGIITEEEKIIPYKNAIDFLRGLQKIGAHQPREGYNTLSYKDLQKACSAFDTVHKGQITWHVLYGCLRPLS